jgi:hypothetical protein
MKAQLLVPPLAGNSAWKHLNKPQKVIDFVSPINRKKQAPSSVCSMMLLL